MINDARQGVVILLRYARLLRLVLFLIFALPPLVEVPDAPADAKNIVLITDGLRWEEVFGAIDPMLMNEKDAHMASGEALKIVSRRARSDPEVGA